MDQLARPTTGYVSKKSQRASAGSAGPSRVAARAGAPSVPYSPYTAKRIAPLLSAADKYVQANANDKLLPSDWLDATGEQRDLPGEAGERASQARRLAELSAVVEDCEAAARPDLTRPFASLRDAAERLLVFHVFAACDSSEVDVEETPDGAGRDLLASRGQLWVDMCVQKSLELQSQTMSLEQQFEAVCQKLASDGTDSLRREEECMLEQTLVAELKASLPPSPPPLPMDQNGSLTLPLYPQFP
eukprot:jgi/Mesvir1/781/Mv17380-RA.1